MKKAKKTLSIILSLLMIISTISALPFTAHALSSSGKCGDNVTYTFDSSTGKLTIQGSGAMDDYSYYDKRSPFYNQSSIKSVVINGGITSIGSYIFRDCESLTSINIPSSVTSIGDSAFGDCTRLTSITIPNSVTSIGKHAFSGCQYLTSINIPSSVTSIEEGVFSSCFRLTSITIPNSVTSIGNFAFSSCSNLTNITIPNNVTNIGNNAFSWCRSLTSITIPNSVTSIGNNAFSSCSNLKSITIPNGVTSIGERAFYYCRSLTAINVDSGNRNYCSVNGILFNNDKTTLIRYPAGKSATNYAIPNSVTSIGNDAFDNCSSLTSIEIPNGVTSIGIYAFYDCTSLTSITIPNSVTSIDSHAFGDCTSLTSITIPNSVTSIGGYAFYNCTSLTSITIPNSVTRIGNYAFNSCSNLKSITIPNGVTSIGELAFDNCGRLTDVYYTGTETEWNNISFGDNNGLTYKTIHYNSDEPSGDTTKPTGSISTTNSVAASQTATLTLRDDTGVAGYYWGTNSSYASNAYTATSAGSITKTVSSSGTYYLTVKDTSGNLSNTVSITYYKTTLNANGGSVSPTSVLTKSGNSFTFPTPARSGYDYKGWNTSNTATSGQTSLTPTGNTTFYAVWVGNNPYNLKDETYSFSNFSDDDSNGGHCFGMSITSAGYYTGNLNRSIIGNTTDSLYSFSKTNTVKKPICHYQKIQGSYALKATVAGGSYYSTRTNDINNDWTSVVNYVKNHEYDNKGPLQIGFRKNRSGHAINFLYYKEVNGQQRIYAYDNNFPNEETYFYKGSDGKIYQAPKATFSGSIDCIALRDVAKYYQEAGDFDGTRCIYAETGAITVTGAVCETPMDCSDDGTEYTMYEFSENDDEAVIIPNTNNATFSYCECDYSFGKIDDDIYGVLQLADPNESATDDTDLSIMSTDEGALCTTHKMTERVVNATCTNDGKIIKTCSVCGYTKTKYISSEGHKIVKDKAVAPTCTKDGKSVGSHCSVCGEVFVKQTTVKALGHKSDKGTVTKKPTYTATGVKTYKCTVCKKVLKTETIAKLSKKTNTLVAKGKTATVKLAKLKKKNQTIAVKNAFAISKAQGKVTYKKASGNAKITVNSAGNITVKKGLKKGTYKVAVNVTAAGNATYKAKTVKVTVVVKVK